MGEVALWAGGVPLPLLHRFSFRLGERKRCRSARFADRQSGRASSNAENGWGSPVSSRRMDPDITPRDIRHAEFSSTFRGFDRAEVESFLGKVAGHIEELEAEVEKLAATIGQAAERNLEAEFETVGREVTGILQAAREAADSMRERASVDAARWRSEAMEEADRNRREAAADAEALRRDAWTAGTELLDQAVEEVKQMREQADRDVLTIQGEAEREAHRLTSSARREAEDLVRNARMEAEKTTSDAAKRRDDIIDQANRQAAAAQERTRALEQRRDELMEELENVRSTLSRLEGSLEEKRETLELSAEESTTVKVIPPAQPQPEVEHWEQGETVRVVRPDDEPESTVDIDLPSGDEDEPKVESVVEPSTPPKPLVEVIPAEAAEERRSQREPQVGSRVQPEAPEQPEAVEEPQALEESEAAEPLETVVGSEQPRTTEAREGHQEDDVDALFEALRGAGQTGESTTQMDEAPSVDSSTAEELDATKRSSETPPDEEAASHDWIEDRDARLLPITNRALRGAKKSLTELQNIALDGLRTDDDWRPDEAVIAETLQAELISVWAESFSAGHAVAEEMTDSKIKRPATPSADVVSEFASALSSAVTKALEEAGVGQRERQAAASRVFRVWRTDEAERRVREMAIRAYQLGVERSVGAEASV